MNPNQGENKIHYKKKYILLFFITAAFSSIIYLISFSLNNSAIVVNTIKLTKAEIKSMVSSSGTIQSIYSKDIFYSYPLKAENIKVKIGDTVKVGQTLIDVDTTQTVQAFSRVYQNNNSNAQPYSQTDVSSISSLINQNSNAISQSSINQILQNYQNQNVNTTINSSSNYNNANGNTDSTYATYPEIPSFVKSPMSGIVTSINITDGDFSSPTVPLVTISNVNYLQVNAQVDELYIDKIKVGQKVIIKGNGFSSVYSGNVSQIYPTANQIVTDTGTRTVVNVLIDVINPNSELKPGLTANIDIITADNKQATTVPYEAINEDDNNKEFVYIFKNNRVYKTFITTGVEYDNCIEILSGIKIGDIIVLSPPINLSNGKHVKQIINKYTPQTSS